MAVYKFKTSIVCQGCVSSVAPVLNALAGISSWKVDTNSEDKILEIETSSIPSDIIIKAVQEVGFSIAKIA